MNENKIYEMVKATTEDIIHAIETAHEAVPPTQWDTDGEPEVKPFSDDWYDRVQDSVYDAIMGLVIDGMHLGDFGVEFEYEDEEDTANANQ